MKLNSLFFLLFCLTSLGLTSCVQNDSTSSASSSSEIQIQKKVKTLLSTLSLEDKVGEMTQLSLDMISVGQPYNLEQPHRLDKEKMQKVLVDLKVGSILNTGSHAQTREHWHEIISDIQQVAVNEKESGIPVLYGIDAIHGANYTSNATLFPQQINLSATWNLELVKKLAAISAYETRASAIPWAFAPVLDIGRDPRWSRFWETLGEDVFLASSMSTAIFEGMQGNDISSKTKVAACMKHFIGYSLPWSGKDRTPSLIPERQMREYFMPTFQAAIDAGAKTVMINSGDVNGIPVHANSKILNDLLRDEMGFRGVAVTDWEDIKYLYTRHGVATDYKDAIKKAINAGIDMSMVPVDLEFPILLKELVDEGEVSIKRINEAVSRILTLKYELGLFETPMSTYEDYPDFASKKHEDLALQGALESLVLLKNDNDLLPLKNNTKILLTGPTANSLQALNGGWTGTWQGTNPQYDTPDKSTILESLIESFGNENVSYVEGTTTIEAININTAVATARKVDIAIICLGEMAYTEKPGDIHDLSLPKAQIKLVQAVAQTGTPIVLVLAEGRPRIISEIESLAHAVIFAGLPGNEGGEAMAQVLSGDYNPNGKLSFTYPRFVNDLMTYDHKVTETHASDFSTNAFNPQWQFGHGLSYSNFAYDDLSVEQLGHGKYYIRIDITNTSTRKGKEIIQLYIRDKVASITPPVKRLKAFEKIEINAGETIEFAFTLTADDLKFVGRENTWITEAGEFDVFIGDQQATFRYD